MLAEEGSIADRVITCITFNIQGCSVEKMRRRKLRGGPSQPVVAVPYLQWISDEHPTVWGRSRGRQADMYELAECRCLSLSFFKRGRGLGQGVAFVAMPRLARERADGVPTLGGPLSCASTLGSISHISFAAPCLARAWILSSFQAGPAGSGGVLQSDRAPDKPDWKAPLSLAVRRLSAQTSAQTALSCSSSRPSALSLRSDPRPARSSCFSWSR